MNAFQRLLPQNPKGLGDVVHHYAQPVAKAVDWVAGKTGKPLNLQGCQGCIGKGGRRDRWNQAVPLGKRPPEI